MRETAAIVRRGVPCLGPVIIEPRLQEVSAGVWNGPTRAEIEAGWPGRLDGASLYNWNFRFGSG